MAVVDLKQLSNEELRGIIKDANALLGRRQKKERAAFVEETKKKAEELGIDLRSLVRAKPPAAKKKRTHKPKYKNPNNPKETWTGLGRPPAWAKEYKENGRLDTILIKA